MKSYEATMAEPAPINILRGHKSPIHAAAFVRGNERLVTGDADGCVMLWDLSIMRPRAVWQAHQNAILSIRGWGDDKIITHGRDHRLVVWQLRRADEDNLKAASPLEQASDALPRPWVLHVLQVNTMNFCAFAACAATPDTGLGLSGDASSIVVAVPNTLLAESIDIFELPSQERIHTVAPGAKHGMAMTLAILHKGSKLVLIAGFENGMCSVFVLDEKSKEWATTYRSKAHAQPVLSIDVEPEGDYFLSSSADALIAKHPVPVTMQTTIADPIGSSPGKMPAGNSDADVPKAHSGLGALLAASAAKPASPDQGVRSANSKAWEDPIKVVNTRHAGQQSLSIRSDGRIFATAGWDSKIRIYAAKSLKELAVLKWHQVGAYAVAFAGVETEMGRLEVQKKKGSEPYHLGEQGGRQAQVGNASLVAQEPGGELERRTTAPKERRMHRAKFTHWVAAGAKDGKLSLWEVY